MPSHNPAQLGPARMQGVPRLFRLDPKARVTCGACGSRLILGILPSELFLPERLEVTIELPAALELLRELGKILFGNPEAPEAQADPPAELPDVRLPSDGGTPAVPPV